MHCPARRSLDASERRPVGSLGVALPPADIITCEPIMLTHLALVCAFLPPTPAVAYRFEQVAPVPPKGPISRSPDQGRAVVLIHGFILHLTEEGVARAEFRDWQKPGCLLV